MISRCLVLLQKILNEQLNMIPEMKFAFATF